MTHLSEVVLQLPQDQLQLVDFPRQGGGGAVMEEDCSFREAAGGFNPECFKTSLAVAHLKSHF